MKVAIVGADCTGKTTLAIELGKALGLQVLSNPNEELLRTSGYHTLFEWAAATQDWDGMLERQAVREQRLDRGVIDHGVVDLFCFVQRWAWNRMSPDHVEALRRQVQTTIASYTHVVVMPPRVVAPPAPWRFRNVNAIRQTDRLVRALLRELGLQDKTCELADAPIEAIVQDANAFVRR